MRTGTISLLGEGSPPAPLGASSDDTDFQLRIPGKVLQLLF